MAKKWVLTDDLESTEVDADAGTLLFGIDGTTWEIDLCNKNADKLREDLKPWQAAGRPVKQHRKGKRHDTVASAPPVRRDKEQLDAIRDWARRQGYDVAPRGRIKDSIVEEFEAQAGRPPQFSAV